MPRRLGRMQAFKQNLMQIAFKYPNHDKELKTRRFENLKPQITYFVHWFRVFIGHYPIPFHFVTTS